MLVEHLVEPEFLTEVVTSRRNFNDFLREFSRQSPRVVGKLQKFSKFRRKTLQVQGEEVNEDQQTMLIELLQFIEETCLVNRNSGIDGNLSFLENCINAHQQSPSHVFCLNEPAGQAVRGIDFIYSADLNDGIRSLPNQRLVQKSLDEMVQATADFLRLSSRITFVDPYFSHRPAMLNPMVKFIELCGANSPVESKEITILLKDRADVPSIQFLMNAITTHIDFNSTGIASLTLTSLIERDNGEALHNRYIISELGALHWGIGLDERNSEVNDDVVMLNDEIFSKRSEQYCELKAFDVKESVTLKF
ncbi:hypothetical protein [Pseudoalteromonas shioyasakiensis]|uniref:hypothetical protein n=1 Tax=Pseudoalteromonas shioyasakiensis TaxID=1190813 RepID=UPI000785B752|nr:hypothetical protein [Pseudoalteromonas shioyasakiensis]